MPTIRIRNPGTDTGSVSRQKHWIRNPGRIIPKLLARHLYTPSLHSFAVKKKLLKRSCLNGILHKDKETFRSLSYLTLTHLNAHLQSMNWRKKWERRKKTANVHVRILFWARLILFPVYFIDLSTVHLIYNLHFSFTHSIVWSTWSSLFINE